MSEGPPSQQLLTGLQERAAHAHPAEEVEQRGGWWLRHAPGCAWWVGTALPHRDDDPGELLWRVGGVEQFYAARGAAAGFQITPGACPGRLDILLAQRRYRRHSPISLQVAPTGRVLERDATESGPPRVRVEGRPTSEWFEVWEAVTGSAADPRAEWDMLERVDRPSAYVSAYEGHDVVAVGRGVADTGWAGVFSMATRPRHADEAPAATSSPRWSTGRAHVTPTACSSKWSAATSPLFICTSRWASRSSADTTTGRHGDPPALTRS